MELHQLLDQAAQIERGQSLPLPTSRHEELISHAVAAIQKWHTSITEADQLRSATPEQIAAVTEISLKAIAPALRRLEWMPINTVRGRWTPPGG